MSIEESPVEIGSSEADFTPEVEIDNQDPHLEAHPHLPPIDVATELLSASGWSITYDAEGRYEIKSNPQADAAAKCSSVGVRLLAHEHSFGFTPTDKHVGHISADNRYVEFVLKALESRFGRGQIHLDVACSHSLRSNDHPSLFPNARTHLGMAEPGPAIWAHVHSPRARTCIEISAASASMAFQMLEAEARWGSPWSRDGRELTRFYSIKIRFENDLGRSVALHVAEELARSLLFEAAASLRTSTSLIPRRERGSYHARIASRLATLRFPVARFNDQAAALFQLASDHFNQTVLNRYILYYQSVEYYLPLHDRKAAIQQIRRTLHSPLFSLSEDEDVLSLIGILGRQSSKSERDSFVDLVADSVGSDRIMNWLTQLERSVPEHFTKRGPIKHVTTLSSKDTSRDIVKQVANRIYDVRCRIVHSKAGGGKEGIEAIFPGDREANALQPDLELLRVVAIEVISGFGSPLTLVGAMDTDARNDA
ncbi:hypothetical protein [Micromonospora parathelypteridis]|uniref:Uncharacterized protein n=1 Tax=Micromonospora parathelypteridis TaxID=1839617 RepID=A0A840VYH7_9ACTN|nr:hypothetical protein [Micromonospora parathelypteridis]MBB5477650.1 hypothetical protein [Micromonospora parathelypteridis]